MQQTKKEILVLQHVANEGAGTLADFFGHRAISLKTLALYRGDALPRDLRNVLAVCIMGGPMNVDEEDKYLFLRDENRFIQRLIVENIPCIGVCLGSQLIAKACGKKVYKAARAEIGWQDLPLTNEAKKDPLFSIFPSPLRVLQWHEDTFDLPDGAVALASGREVPNQAYRLGRNIYGMQFHLEVNRGMLEDWFRGKPELRAVLEEFDRYKPKLFSWTKKMYGEFLALSERGFPLRHTGNHGEVPSE